MTVEAQETTWKEETDDRMEAQETTSREETDDDSGSTRD